MVLNAMGGQNDSIENIELTLVRLSPGSQESAGKFIVTTDGKVIVGFGYEHVEMWKKYCEQTGRNEKAQFLAAGRMGLDGTVQDRDWSSHTLGDFETPYKNRRKVSDFLKKAGGFLDMFMEWDKSAHS